MKLIRLHYVAVAAVAIAAVAAASSAQARDVYWSVGVQAAPGVTVGAGNYRPVYVAPAPVYVAPAPVYLAPAPVYYAPPPRVYYGPVVYHGHPHKQKWKGKRHNHWR